MDEAVIEGARENGARGVRADVFTGAGPMRASCRALDWAATPLGAVETWPQSLRTAAASALGAGFPTVLLWGPKLVQLYNDAAVPLFAARHPAALGQPTQDCWPELWDVAAPTYARVLAGETVTLVEAHFPAGRDGSHGVLEDLYLTISYGPVPDEAGRVVGVLVTLLDTTAQVVGRAGRAEQAQFEAQLHGALLDTAHVLEQVSDAYVLMDGDFRITAVNPSAERLLGRPRADLLGRTHWDAFPASVGAEPERQYRRVAAERVEAHFVYHYVGESYDFHLEIDAYPVRHGGVAVFWRDVSVRVCAEAERERLLATLESERTLLRTVLAQMPAAVLIVEAPSGRVLALNDAVADVWGGPRPLTDEIAHYSEEWVGYHLDGRRIASEEWPIARAALFGETVTDWVGEIERPDGTRGTIEVNAAPIRDATGRTVAAVGVVADVTARVLAARERERLLHALDVERARLANVFEQAPSFLAVVRGPTYVFELVNAAYTELVGGRDVVGKAALDAFPEVREQGFIELLDNVLATGKPFVGRAMPFALASTPGAALEQRFVDLSYIPLVEPDGTRSGVICHGSDVTKQVEARREIERLLAESEGARMDAEAARAEAEAANRSKGEFLAVMSHELRTPLNAIGGYVELIELGIRGPVTPAQREDLARIQKSQRHLLGLINGVLNYSRAEAGAVHYEMIDVPLDAVLVMCETLIAPQARTKQIALHLSACSEPFVVRADREKLQQIVVNLLTNAVKFTAPGGTVTLACGRDSRPRAAGSVVVTVRDTGRGIAADALERVFEPFVQVDAGLTRTQDGIGLGLAISRDLARRMGGDLVAESTFGVGSTFTLSLPAP